MLEKRVVPWQFSRLRNQRLRPAAVPFELNNDRSDQVLKFIGGTIGIIFLIGLLVVIGLFALIF